MSGTICIYTDSDRKILFPQLGEGTHSKYPEWAPHEIKLINLDSGKILESIGCDGELYGFRIEGSEGFGGYISFDSSPIVGDEITYGRFEICISDYDGECSHLGLRYLAFLVVSISTQLPCGVVIDSSSVFSDSVQIDKLDGKVSLQLLEAVYQV